MFMPLIYGVPPLVALVALFWRRVALVLFLPTWIVRTLAFRFALDARRLPAVAALVRAICGSPGGQLLGSCALPRMARPPARPPACPAVGGVRRRPLTGLPCTLEAAASSHLGGGSACLATRAAARHWALLSPACYGVLC